MKDVQSKQQENITRDINILRSNLTATTKNLADVKENLRNKNEEFQKQLESLTNEVNNHLTGLSSRFDAESVLRKARPSNPILVLPFKILEFIF